MAPTVKQVVKETDRVHPEKNPRFIRYVPLMHHYSEVMEYVGGYRYLSELYCKTILELYDNNLPFEIEKAVITKAHSNMIFDLRRAGHTYSECALKVLKKKDEMIYNFIKDTKKI